MLQESTLNHDTHSPDPASRSFGRTRRSLLTWAGLGLMLPAVALADQPPVNTLKNSFFSSRTDTAINGHDTVAYFTVGKPVKGLDSLATTWMGAVWKFSSQANLDLFKANPEKYAPQYGGYCAYGVAQGSLVKVEPEQFTVRDGKLYLNYDADIQAKWLKDTATFIKSADVRFPQLLKQ
jgi:YHS domain-containing protein